jgi:hypothetical protein
VYIGCIAPLAYMYILHMVAHPIGDGLQPPGQGLHEVYQVPHPLKSSSKHDFTKKFVFVYFKVW